MLQRLHQATGLLVALAIALSGCKSERDHAAPPRVTSVLDMPSQSSTLVVPIELSLDDLQGALEREMPRQLWSIDERHSKCIGGKRVKAFGRRLKVTPDIDCWIVGEVTRGAIALSGSGNRLTISMPERPSTFLPLDDQRIAQHVQPGRERPAPRYSPEDLARCMPRYTVERGRLLRNGMQEFLFKL